MGIDFVIRILIRLKYSVATSTCMLLILTAFQPVFAFTIHNGGSSQLKGWNSVEPLKFNLNSSACPTDVPWSKVVQKAMDLWNSNPSSKLRLELGSEVTGSANLSNPPLITCASNFASTGADPNGTAGLAYISAPNDTISAGLIIINNQAGTSAAMENLTETERAIVVAHEIGHVLGLGHSPDESSLMYFNGSYREELSLSQDDFDGLTYFYPKQELEDTKPLGCGTVVGKASGSDQGPFGSGRGPLVVTFLLIFPLLLTRALQSRFRKRA